MERQTGKRCLAEGQEIELSKGWDASPRTWFGQQKTGSPWGLHQDAYSMATKTPLKKVGQEGTFLDYADHLCFLVENCMKLFLLDTASFQNCAKLNWIY